MFTIEDLVLSVREVAEENPDRVYVTHPGTRPPCQYWWQGCPDCVIGHGLHRRGLSPGSLPSWGMTVWQLLPALRSGGFLAEFPEDSREMLWLTTVQEHQDRRFTWAESVLRADGMFPLPKGG